AAAAAALPPAPASQVPLGCSLLARIAAQGGGWGLTTHGMTTVGSSSSSAFPTNPLTLQGYWAQRVESPSTLVRFHMRGMRMELANGPLRTWAENRRASAAGAVPSLPACWSPEAFVMRTLRPKQQQQYVAAGAAAAAEGGAAEE